MILNIVNLNGGETKLELFLRAFPLNSASSFSFAARGVEKVMLVYGQKGIGLPLIHSFPHHLLSLLPEMLRLSLPLFFMF